MNLKHLKINLSLILISGILFTSFFSNIATSEAATYKLSRPILTPIKHADFEPGTIIVKFKEGAIKDIFNSSEPNDDFKKNGRLFNNSENFSLNRLISPNFVKSIEPLYEERYKDVQKLALKSPQLKTSELENKLQLKINQSFPQRALRIPADLSTTTMPNEKNNLSDFFVIKLKSDKYIYTTAIKNYLNRLPQIASAELNGYGQGGSAPNDTLYTNQWGHKNTGQIGESSAVIGADINSETGWDITKGSPDIIIAVLDSGIDMDHPDLAAKLVPGKFYNGTSTQDDYGHGTKASGVAAAIGNNDLGIAGTCQNCSIMPVKVIDSQNYASWTSVSKGIYWSVSNGADVISMSIVSNATQFNSGVETAINYAVTSGVPVFVSRGNAGNTSASYPADYANSISVGGMNACNTRAISGNCSSTYSSSYGRNLDFMAPSSNIYTTTNGGGYIGSFNGTSAAAPFAAGVAGLMLSVNPNLSPTQIRQMLNETAVDMGPTGYDSETGNGRLNAGAAVTAANIVEPSYNLAYSSLQINDSTGNNNGTANSGENMTLTITIDNLDSELTNATGTLGTTDSSINIPSPIATFNPETIPGQSSANISFPIEISSNATSHTANFDLTVNSDTFSKTVFFDLNIVRILDLSYLDYTIDDSLSGNNNRTADAGESFQLTVNMRNVGSSQSNISGFIQSDSTNFNIIGQNTSTMSPSDIALNASASITYNINIPESAPSHEAPLTIDFSSADGNESIPFTIPVNEKVLPLPPADWQEQNSFTQGTSNNVPAFGHDSDIMGNLAIIGAPLENVSYTKAAGAAYVYKKVGNNWEPEAKINATNLSKDANFGWTVATDGQQIIVGEFGAAHIFAKKNGIWQETNIIKSPNIQETGKFGLAVDIAGNYAVIGAPYENGETGNAYIYYTEGDGQWQLQATITPSDGTSKDYFGTAVAINKDRVLIGSNGKNNPSNAFRSGKAYVYLRNGTNWNEEQILSANDADTSQNFAASLKSLAIEDTRIVIGAGMAYSSSTERGGAVYVYEFNGTGWQQKAKLIPNDTARAQMFGGKVSLSANRILITAARDNEKGANAGALYTFLKLGNNWVQESKIMPSIVSANDSFGTSAGLYGNDVLASVNTGASKVYFFKNILGP